MRYPYLLFDADNTLFNFDEANAYAFKTVCDAFSLPYSQELYACYKKHNRAAWDKFDRGLATKEQIVIERYVNFLDEIGSSLDPIECNRVQLEGLGRSVFMIPHAVEVIETLFKTHRLFLVTNAVASVQKSRLAKSPLAPYIEQAFISETAGASKPSRAYFEYVFAHIDGITKENCLVIGDSLATDMQGANNFSLPCCWYNPKGARNDKGLRIDHEIADLRELLEIV